MTKEETELLEEAKKRYPIGVKYRDANLRSGRELEQLEITRPHRYVGNTDLKCIEAGVGYIMYKGQWADIISKPEVKSTEPELIQGNWYELNSGKSQLSIPYVIKYKGISSGTITASKYFTIPKKFEGLEGDYGFGDVGVYNYKPADLETVYKYFPEERPKVEEIWTDGDCIFINKGLGKTNTLITKGIRISVAAYVKANQFAYDKDKLRKANSDEIQWLDKCISKGEFVPKEEALSAKPEKLSVFPSEGQCDVLDERLTTYLENRPSTTGPNGTGTTKDKAKIVSWNSSSHWHVISASGKTKYTIDQLEPFIMKTEGFVLPEKWCIEVTPKNVKVISAWGEAGDCTSYGYCLSLSNGKRGYWVNSKPIDYKEITFKQFQKYVLKSETPKKEYRYEAVHCITQDQWDFVLDKFNPLNLNKNLWRKGGSECLIFGGTQTKGTHGSVNYLQQQSSLIISFEEWCTKFGHTFKPKTSKFEIGKWYKIKAFDSQTEYYFKAGETQPNGNDVMSNCFICNGSFFTGGAFSQITLIKTDVLDEIQQYLPEGHVDKVKKPFILEKGNFYYCVWKVNGKPYIFDTANGCNDNRGIKPDVGVYFTSGGFNNPSQWKEIRLATLDEKDWLERCIKAGKFVPKEESMKIEEFKVGDYVECTRSTGCVERGMIGKILKIDSNIGVEWEGITGGHTLDGYSKSGKGWYMQKEDIKKASKEEKMEILVGRWIKHKKTGKYAKITKWGSVGLVDTEMDINLNVHMANDSREESFVYDYELMPKDWTPETEKKSDWIGRYFKRVAAGNGHYHQGEYLKVLEDKDSEYVTLEKYGNCTKYPSSSLFEVMPIGFIPLLNLDKPMKSQGSDFNVGDWVTITKSGDNWNSEMNKFDKRCVQITEKKSPNQIKFKDSLDWCWNFNNGHFRQAYPHEIPVESKPVDTRESLLEEAKRRFPIGCEFYPITSTGLSKDKRTQKEECHWYEGTGGNWIIGSYNIRTPEGEWAEIVSKPAFDHVALQGQLDKINTPWPIGTRVMLKKDSRYYYQAKGEVGIIKSNNNPGTDLIYTVEWEKARENEYGQVDLELFQEAPYPEGKPIIYGTGGEIPKRRFYKGDKVKFKTTSNEIPKYEYESIPKELIKHGSRAFKVNEGVVVDFHKEYIIVKYVNKAGRNTQLGFKEDVLIPVYTAGYPLTVEEAYLAGYDTYQKEAEVLVRIDAEVSTLHIPKSASVTLKNSENEVKINVKQVKAVQLS